MTLNYSTQLSLKHCEDLQKDLTVSGRRAMKWQMKLNVGKCKVRHARKENTAPPITPLDQVLQLARN